MKMSSKLRIIKRVPGPTGSELTDKVVFGYCVWSDSYMPSDSRTIKSCYWVEDTGTQKIIDTICNKEVILGEGIEDGSYDSIDEIAQVINNDIKRKRGILYRMFAPHGQWKHILDIHTSKQEEQRISEYDICKLSIDKSPLSPEEMVSLLKALAPIYGR